MKKKLAPKTHGGPRQGAGAPKGNQSARKHKIPLSLVSARVTQEIKARLDKEAQERRLAPSALLAALVTEHYSPHDCGYCKTPGALCPTCSVCYSCRAL